MMALLVTLVTFTLPWNLAGPNPCTQTGATMSDLDSVKVSYLVSGTLDERVAFAGPVHGQEGQSMTVDVPTTAPATVWVQTKRPLSRWSCASGMIGVNLTLDVPVSHVRELDWYDVTGRKITPPTKPGLYWKRWRGERIGHVIVIR
jgi:hypothetical protein